MENEMIGYPLKFKAAILERTNESLVVEEVTFAGPLETGQVLVQIHYSGICGKQIEEIQGTGGPDLYLPHMLGHEGSGVVVDVASGVRKVAPGDHVVLHWMKGSGIDSPAPIYTRRGERVNAGWITTFNEYGVISENRMTPISKKADLKVVCLLGCAVTTGVGVILNEANLRPGDSVAVFGCGGVGLSAIQGASLVNSYPIIAVDRNPKSLELARKLGASHGICSTSNDVIGEIRKITGGKGAKFVVVSVGEAQVTELAAKVSSIPGSVFLVGVPPAGSMITVDALDIHMGRTFLGSYGGGTVPDRDIPAYLDLNHKGHLKLRELITNIVSLDQINEGISSCMSGIAGRCIVKIIDNEDQQE